MGDYFLDIETMSHARLERPATESWITVSSSPSLTWEGWEELVGAEFPGWELVTTGDNIS